MRKAISSVAVGVALTALLSTSVVVAVSASAASSTCNAVDAPKAMNDLPASADCPTPGSSGGLHANALAPAVTLIATTQISSTPLNFDRTDGDVLAVTGIDGQSDWLAIGGDFGTVIIPAGALSCPGVNP